MIDPATPTDTLVSLAMSVGEAWGGAAAASGIVGIVGGGVAAIAAWGLARHAQRRNLDALRRIAQFAADRAEDSETARPPIEGEYADVVHAIERAADDTFKRAQEARQKARASEIELGLAKAELSYLEAILHTISDAVVVTDAFDEVALANAAAADALGFELSDSAQQHVDRVVRDTQLATLIKDTRDSGDCSRRRRMEKRLPTRDGDRVFDVTLASLGDKPQRDDDGNAPASPNGNGVNGVVTVLRDVTKEREIAESKSHFVSSVSHELRTPLSSIAAYIEMLIDGEADDPESREEFYRIIQTETTRLARLIDNMLNISRIESGIVRAQRERILLAPIIREALDVMSPQAEAKQIELVDKLSPIQDYVFADRDMMYQVVLNLI
ncbi:MAG: histidine kinase dimerization/phospho-acceptor domain-containing protein, partial [Actinomycetota bacterium]